MGTPRESLQNERCLSNLIAEGEWVRIWDAKNKPAPLTLETQVLAHARAEKFDGKLVFQYFQNHFNGTVVAVGQVSPSSQLVARILVTKFQADTDKSPPDFSGLLSVRTA